MAKENSTKKPEFQYVHILSLPDSNLCQCCLSTKDLRSIVKPYLYRGKNEIYSDMLTMCFSKELSANDGWICSDCVRRLRATVSFRECVESAKNYLNSQLETKKDIPAISCESPPSPEPKKSSRKEKKRKTDNGKYFDRHEMHVESDDDDYVDDFNYDDDRPLVIKEEVVNLLSDLKAATNGLSSLAAVTPAAEERSEQWAVPVPPTPKASSKLPSGSESSSDEDFFEECFKPVTTSQRVFNRMEFDVGESSTLPYALDSTDRTCEICHKEFSFFGELLNHMPEHYPNHICDICGKICATRKSFEFHIKIHTDVRYQCEKCDKSFKNKNNLSKHEKVTHKGHKLLFKCNMCGEALDTYSQRIKHMTEKHGREAKTYKCQQCPCKYTLGGHLRAHIRRVHLQEKNHKCQECSSAFFTRKCLEQHSAKHTGVRNFSCHICSKSYKTKYGLRLHTKTHEVAEQQDGGYMMHSEPVLQQQPMPVAFVEEDQRYSTRNFMRM